MTGYEAFRTRVHQRVCLPARSCTCPDNYGTEVLAEAREYAGHVHEKFNHPGTVDNCGSPDDVICKAAAS